MAKNAIGRLEMDVGEEIKTSSIAKRLGKALERC